MVEMICGAYGAKGRLIRPADGPFSLSAEEERRLVNRGVARYVRESVTIPPGPPPSEPEESGGETLDPYGSMESEHLLHEDLDTMTKDSLLKITAQLGLEANARMNKADILQVIHNALTHTDESDLPDLTPEGPVV